MRKFLLFMFLAAVLAPVTLGQITSTIGSTACSPTSNYIPWYHLYDFSEAQYGIPATELAVLGTNPVTITEIGWYCCGTLPTGDYSLRVYLTELPGTFDLATLYSNPVNNISLGTMVANGKILTGAGAEKMMMLDTQFVYTPGNHLIVTTCDVLSGWSSSFSWAANAMAGNGHYRYRDGSVYDCNGATAESTNYSANVWATTILGYVPAGATCDLTMLAPGGAGAGTTIPGTGTWLYVEDATATITATPNVGSLFDYWELDGSFYSYNEVETVLMNTDHTVQAFFKPFAALALPFYEDFTGVPSGGIPANWDRTHTNWAVASSNMAGGVAPEMQFSWSPLSTNQFRLITPRLDGTTETEILCSFKHYTNDYNSNYTLRVQTSTDSGATWQDRWSTPGGALSGDVYVNLNPVAGEEFLVAIVYDGDSYNINYWYVDDIYIGEPPLMWELDMLDPYGQGLVSPDVGLHDMILDGKVIPLAALPSATWYAADAYPGDDLIVFDTMNPAGFGIIAENIAPDFLSGGTWADGVWYVTNYHYSNSYLWTVNPDTGAMGFVGAMSQPIHGLGYDEVNDIMYGTTAYNLCTINRSTGAATVVGSHGGSLLMIDIAYGDGVLYGHCIATDSMYTINVSTGLGTLIGPTGYDANYAQGMEYDKDQSRLFLALYTSDGYLAEVDMNTGAAALYGSFNGHEICALSIPYDIEHPWVFDRWEVDGVLYSNDPLTTLTMNEDHTAQAFFTPTGEICTLTMLAPLGVGTGTVSPGVGSHIFVVGTTAYLSASPEPGSMLDHWNVDGAFYSVNPTAALVMDIDHTAQAFFNVDTTISCDLPTVFSQPVDAMEVATNSDANYGYIAADDFTGLTETIYGVNFWACELDAGAGWTICTKPSQDYIVRFYEYDMLPTTIVYEETITMTRIPSSKYLFDNPSYGPIYKYIGQLSTPVSMTDGWFSVQGVDSGTCACAWVDGGPIGAVGDYDYAQYADGAWGYSGYSYNLAFCLLGESAAPPDPTNCTADPDELCVGDDALLTADSTFEIHWFDDVCGGNEIGVGSPLTVNPLVSTTYFARAYDPIIDEWSNGCCDVTVTVYPLPEATASNNSTFTVPLEEGDDLELVGGPDGMDYYWEGPDAWTSTDQNPIRTDVDDTMAGLYTLTVTDVNGCVGAATTTVYIGEPPPIPTMGLTGLGILLLAVGSLMSFARRRK